MKIKVIYEDNHLIVVDKPQGIAVQSDGTRQDLFDLTKEYLKETYSKPGNVFLGLVHRLDTNVGGVVIFAKTSKAASRISDQIRNRSTEKYYLAVVEGIPLEGLITHKVSKDEVNKIAYLDELNGKEALLELGIIESQNALSLCKIKLLTGRYHQIRFQLGQIGNPIYGDQKYGSQFASNHIALWCQAMKIKHPVKDEFLEFNSTPNHNQAPWVNFDKNLIV